ncbi:hypothetical protein JTE90_000847 [Oedothorax gibbosus]|uniref:Uncharacterized protein n=1 Tax=Oedothorax gibbosus TaxID=931172 RepID=A0AAV6VST2_9ARAC|nr:hypothetical protein JTE90_000847 [Oedothorax gibbosus]
MAKCPVGSYRLNLTPSTVDELTPLVCAVDDRGIKYKGRSRGKRCLLSHRSRKSSVSTIELTWQKSRFSADRVVWHTAILYMSVMNNGLIMKVEVEAKGVLYRNLRGKGAYLPLK